MVRWLAPILCFTAEEIWGFLPGKRSESVFLETWHALPQGRRATAIDWNMFIALKAAVALELEKLRVEGTVGGSLDAEVEVFSKDEHLREAQGAGRGAAFPAHRVAGAGEARQQCRGSAGRRHQGGRDRQGRRRVDSRAGEHGAQVRALLASPARRGLECGASDDLRPVRGQSSTNRANLGPSYESDSREHVDRRQRHPLVVDLVAGDRGRSAQQAVDRADHGARRQLHRAADARHRARAQLRRGVQLPGGRRRLAALGVHACWRSASRSRW